MAGADGIKVEGTVVEILPRGLYRVELANGHRLMAHFTGRARKTAAALAAGEKVNLEMSFFDLSKGRILSNENEL